MAGQSTAWNAVDLNIISIHFTGSIIGQELSSSLPGCGKSEFALSWAMGVRHVQDTKISFPIPAGSTKMNVGI